MKTEKATKASPVTKPGYRRKFHKGMVTVTFRQQMTKANTHPIQMMISCGWLVDGKYAKILKSTGISVEESKWDAKRKLVIGDPSSNAVLTAIEADVKEMLEVLLTGRLKKRELTKQEFDEVKSQIQKVIEKAVNRNHGSDFFVAYEPSKKREPMHLDMTFVDYCSARMDAWTDVKKDSKKRYRNFINKFRTYDPKVKVREVNDEVMGGFISWFRKEYPEANISYLGSMIVAMKKFLNEPDTTPLGFRFENVNLGFKIYRKTKPEVVDVYWSLDQIKRMMKLEFEDKSLELVRDMAVVASMTGGLRTSDWKWYTANRVKDWPTDDGGTVRGIFVRHQKTGKSGLIPVYKPVEEILEKWNYNFPKLSEQKWNLKIKEVCRLASQIPGNSDFGELVEIRRKLANGNMDIKHVPFHELVSTSTCRRSFCSIYYYDFRYKPEEIMAFSLHSNMQSFLAYIEEAKSVKLASKAAELYRTVEF